MLLTVLNDLLTLPNIYTFGAFAVLMVVVFVMGMLLVRLAQDPIRARLESLSKGDGMPPSAGIWEGLATQIPQTGLDSGILDREIRRHRATRYRHKSVDNGARPRGGNASVRRSSTP